MNSLRDQIESDEFDYQVLMDALSDYAAPRARVTALLRSGEIIRVKKGLYVFGPHRRKFPVCRELLANLIYGPSVVSLESALAYYRLIPERVDAVTSVTTGRPGRFETPLGLFIYRPTPGLSLGIDRLTGSANRAFLMAVPERALADKIREDRATGLRTQQDMEVYLYENLRMEPEAVRDFSPDMLEQLAECLCSHKVRVLAGLVRSARRKQ
ncbi:MAG: hypothetical protein WC959_00705 [Kiritimatiellales bacterium]